LSQTVPGESGTLSRITVGSTIEISTDDSRVTGKALSVSANSVTVAVDGSSRILPISTIRQIDVAHRSTKKGAQLGLVVGVIGGIALSVPYIREWNRTCGPVEPTVHSCDDAWPPGAVASGRGVLGMGIGAAVGAMIGSRHVRNETVFKASPSSRIGVAPMIDRTRRGVTIAVHF